MNPISAILLLGLVAIAAAAGGRGADPPHLTPTACGSLHCHLLSHLPQLVGCCLSPQDRDRGMSAFASQLVAACKDETLASMDTCIARATMELLGDACVCINREQLSTSLSNHMRESVRPALTRQAMVSIPGVEYPNTPGKKSEQTGDVVSAVSCSDPRQEGPLCSKWRANTHTAGNTLCRPDHQCDDHGYSYVWCYTSFDNDWEYCCSGTCDFHNKAYRWCQSIDEWEYCGFYDDGKGLHNVKGHVCLDEHPCGKHGYWYDTYWCQTDNAGSWDYCCAPGESCGNDCYIDDSSETKRNCRNTPL